MHIYPKPLIMSKHGLLKIPPQKDCISLQDGKNRTAHWKQFMNTTIYKGEDKDLPHGIFIPFIDVQELVKLGKKIKHVHVEMKGRKVKKRIHIVGVRAYYSFTATILDPIGVGQTQPISAQDYPVEAVLVLVYQFINKKNPTKKDLVFRPGKPTHDLIVPVPSVRDMEFAGSAGDYSIFDITQPCPNLCDTNSALH